MARCAERGFGCVVRPSRSCGRAPLLGRGRGRAARAVGAAGIGFTAGRNTTEEMRGPGRERRAHRVRGRARREAHPAGEPVHERNADRGAERQVAALDARGHRGRRGGVRTTRLPARQAWAGREPIEAEPGSRERALCSTSRDRFTDAMNSHVSVRGNDARGDHDGVIQLNCAGDAGFRHRRSSCYLS